MTCECGFDVSDPCEPLCSHCLDERRAATREHLDRGLTPRPPWYLQTDDDGEPAVWWRAPVDSSPPWRAWFSGDEYLGEVSGRTRPDDVNASQRCDCPVCRGTVNP